VWQCAELAQYYLKLAKDELECNPTPSLMVEAAQEKGYPVYLIKEQ
jgi:hypothetical protein